MPKCHHIKLNIEFCNDVLNGDKCFEVRENDRGYQRGDLVRFEPYDPRKLCHHPIEDKTFGFNIKEIKEYQIPRLAQGAVIPPNQQFAAILGDQKHGRNLEAPEGLIRQIVREELGNVYSPVLNAINNSNLGKKAVIMGDVYMDSQKVGRVVARPVFKEGNRAGYIKVKV